MSPTLRVGLLCLALVMLVSAVVRHEHGMSGDEPFYERMAGHPGGAHNFPYAYRVGVPWLVHVLPFSHTVSWTLIAWLAIAAAGAALYALIREFDTGERLAGALAVGFVLSPVLLIVLIRHGRSIDPAAVLVIVLGCLFVVRHDRAALAVTVLAGTTIRESSLFLLPLAYAVWAQRPLDRDALRDTAAVAALPVIAYVLIRTGVHAVGRQYVPGYNGPFLRDRWDVVRDALSSRTIGAELRRLAYTFGPLWLVAPLALRTLPFARRGLVLVALCAASLTFAFDWARIAFLAAPVVYVAAAHVLAGRRRLAIATVAVLLAVDAGYGVYMQVHGTRHGLDSAVGRGVPAY